MIDTAFDFRIDAGGRDPDTHSPTLRRYHRLLWSKQLPGGGSFELTESAPGAYLHHDSELGQFCLASDSVIQTFTRWSSAQSIVRQMAKDENEEFQRVGYTIGGMLVYPGNRVDGKQTINVARGFNRRIADRFDLTLECVRRHYRSQASPLAETLERYRDFFNLFEDFRGYVEFFLLQDLVSEDFSDVRFFTAFEEFGRRRAVPGDVATYAEFRRNSIDFVLARNRRIDRWAREHL